MSDPPMDDTDFRATSEEHMEGCATSVCSKCRLQLSWDCHHGMASEPSLFAGTKRIEAHDFQPGTCNCELGRLRAENEKLKATLKAYYEAEWMVTHDWGGDRNAILNRVRDALGLEPFETEAKEQPDETKTEQQSD